MAYHGLPWFTMVYPIFFLGLCHFGGYLEGLGSFKMVSGWFQDGLSELA